MIKDSAGNPIQIGDKVRTADGRVIRVRGFTSSERLYMAKSCTIVDKDTPHSVSGGQTDGDTDTVIWGN